MSRAWKQLAERIFNEAFDSGEVRNAFGATLKQDWRKGEMESLVQSVREILAYGQSHLFCDQRAESLKLLRREAASSPLQNVFLDCVDMAVARGHSGGDVLRVAVCQTLSDHATRGARQVEEHYLRKSRQRRVSDIRQRIQGAINGLDIAATARHLLGLDKNEALRPLAKQTGLDDGVHL
jgi:hypothetical protein